jgi:hypothetical protein
MSEYVIGVDRGKVGFSGWGPQDRVASTGVFSFSLLNENHRFTPGHIDCTSGFQEGVKFRLVLEYSGGTVETVGTVFYGTVKGIDFEVYNSFMVTNVTALDYMDQLARHELELPTFAQDKRIDEVVPLIIANMPIAPLNTDYGTGQDTFASVFDTVKAKTYALSELSKVTLSELGYTYVKHGIDGGLGVDRQYVVADGGSIYTIGGYKLEDLNNGRPIFRNTSNQSYITVNAGIWGIVDYMTGGAYVADDVYATPDLVTTWVVDGADAPAPTAVTVLNEYDEALVVEGRYSRKDQALATVDGDDAIFNVGIDAVQLSHGKYYYNTIKTVTYPREVDATATSVLFTLNRYVAIDAGATVTVTGRFVDPDQEAISVSGIDMVTPVATTDYLFNSASDGSGSDITADLDVTATYGTNGVEYELTNNNAGVGYVTFLQARGKGVYTYRPVEHEKNNSSEVTSFGKSNLSLNLYYQDNPLVGEDFAQNLIDLYSTRHTVVEAIALDTTNEFNLQAFMKLRVGDKIKIVVPEAAVDGNYFIYAIDYQIDPSGFVSFAYRVASDSLMTAEGYWELNSATLSQLGETTVLGF